LEYNVGDIIEDRHGMEYEVRDVKRGGFGIVYIVYNKQWKGIVAIKSFQDKYFYGQDI